MITDDEAIRILRQILSDLRKEVDKDMASTENLRDMGGRLYHVVTELEKRSKNQE